MTTFNPLMRMMLRLLLSICALLICASAVAARDSTIVTATAMERDTGIIGLHDSQLDAGYWLQRLSNPDHVLLDPAAIAAQNARMQRIDPALYDIEHLPASLERARISAWIESRSTRPRQVLYDQAGKLISSKQIDAWTTTLNLAGIPERQATRYGLITQRAAIRTFPTRQRVFDQDGDHDIDRFQETALFPGTPVVIVHTSHDDAWWFVVSTTYAGWIDKLDVAEGGKQQVFGYAGKSPGLVVTGASVRTVFTPEQPSVSELALDMGVRLPWLSDWPVNQLVNGQHPHAGYVVELPTRQPDGALRIVPALIPRSADVAINALPMTRGNIVRQAFKFLGERYGWGHDYHGRDCSGFIGEIYRSFNVLLPRNTSDQATSPAFAHINFAANTSHAERLATLQQTQVGDLLYMPGHVMLVVGHQYGTPYVIHDTAGIYYRKPDSTLTHVKLNGVSLTPLFPLLSEDGQPLIDRITTIQRLPH